MKQMAAKANADDGWRISTPAKHSHKGFLSCLKKLSPAPVRMALPCYAFSGEKAFTCPHSFGAL